MEQVVQAATTTKKKKRDGRRCVISQIEKDYPLRKAPVRPVGSPPMRPSESTKDGSIDGKNPEFLHALRSFTHDDLNQLLASLGYNKFSSKKKHEKIHMLIKH